MVVEKKDWRLALGRCHVVNNFRVGHAIGARPGWTQPIAHRTLNANTVQILLIEYVKAANVILKEP